jgi:hypothetical protein
MSDNKVLNLALTVEELNLVLGALAELPYKVSMNLIAKVSNQAQQQLQASTPEVDNG